MSTLQEELHEAVFKGFPLGSSVYARITQEEYWQLLSELQLKQGQEVTGRVVVFTTRFKGLGYVELENLTTMRNMVQYKCVG